MRILNTLVVNLLRAWSSAADGEIRLQSRHQELPAHLIIIESAQKGEKSPLPEFVIRELEPLLSHEHQRGTRRALTALEFV